VELTGGELVGSRRRLTWSSRTLPPGCVVRVVGNDTALNTAFALAQLGFPAADVAETGYVLASDASTSSGGSPSVLRHYIGPHFRWEISGFWPTVREELALGGKLPVDPLTDDAIRVLDLAHLLERHPHRLSGGETAKVVLAAHLVHKPHHLVLDRVFAELDAPARRGVLASVRSWIPAATFVLDEGLDGTFDATVSTDGPMAEWRADAGKDTEPTSWGKEAGLTLKVNRARIPAPECTLELRDFTVARDSGDVFPPQRLQLGGGDLVLVQGPNGCGKTTLLEGVAGLLTARGELHIRRDGKRLDPLRAFAFSPQDPQGDITEMGAQRELELACSDAGMLAAALAEVGFPAGLLRTPLHEDVGLSKLTSVVAATLRGRVCCLLDEPTIYLGRALRPIAERAIRRYREHGGIVFCSTHDAELVAGLSR
jgi:energy-coupling factor transporter ATP-binding protein EcfA2